MWHIADLAIDSTHREAYSGNLIEKRCQPSQSCPLTVSTVLFGEQKKKLRIGTVPERTNANWYRARALLATNMTERKKRKNITPTPPALKAPPK